MTALFLVPAYSAVLLTFMIVPIVKLPFTDMQSFVQDGTYKLGFSTQQRWDVFFNVSSFDLNYPAWESLLNFFFKHTNEIWSKLAYDKYSLDPSEMPKNDYELRKKICKTQKKIAFIIFDDDIYPIKCRIIKIPSSITTGWYGFDLRKNSPYHKVFNKM